MIDGLGSEGRSEEDARQLMRLHRVERDASDIRSCSQIVQALGLIPAPEEIIETNQPNNTAQAINMTANVSADPSPYFSN